MVSRPLRDEAGIRATWGALLTFLGQVSFLLLLPLIKLKKTVAAPTVHTNQKTVYSVPKTRRNLRTCNK